MGVTLFDQETGAAIFDVNFWHWRAIVETIRNLGVLPGSRVDDLHEPFVGRLSEAEARAVGGAIRERLLPTLGADERLLLRGRRTADPDTATFYRAPEDLEKNYSTDRRVLERFAKSCEECGGFRVA
jgi:hypothetical protein